MSVPQMRPLGAVFYHIRDFWIWGKSFFTSRLIYEQMLRYRCNVGSHVQLDGDAPWIYGDGSITVGNDVRIGNRNTWIVGLKVFDNARLEIGDGATLGYMNVISVAKSVRIGRHCLFAGEVKILDNNSHSLDFEQRRQHAPLKPDEVAPVVIEDDVWIGTNCIVLKGVTIGKGAVIASSSVVTGDIPAFTVAAGNPARVVKKIEPYFSQDSHAVKPGGSSPESR